MHGRLTRSGAGVPGKLDWSPASGDSNHRRRTTEADGEGGFSLELDGPGPWIVDARRHATQVVVSLDALPGGLRLRSFLQPAGAASRIQVDIRSEGLQRVDVELPAGRLIGWVVYSEGGLAVPTQVQVRREEVLPGLDAAAEADAPCTPWTDSDGRFEFFDLAPGRWMLEAMGVSWYGLDSSGALAPASHTVEGIQIGEGPAACEVRMELPRGYRLSGRAIDERGAPVSFAHLSAWDAAGRALWVGGEMSTLRDGQFSLPALSPGEYTLLARAGERVSRPLALHVGPSRLERLELELRPGAFVELELPTSDSARARLSAVRDAAGRDLSAYARRDERPSADHTARFLVGPLPPGDLELELAANDGASRVLSLRLGEGERVSMRP